MSILSLLSTPHDRRAADRCGLEAQAAVERLAALASRSIADDFRAERESPLERMQTGAVAWRGIAGYPLTD